MNLQAGFDAIKSERVNYFRPYTFDRPLAFSIETNLKMQQLGLILYKAIDHLVEHYLDYLHLMPRMERDLEILEICDRFSYRIGAYRTDFVIDENDVIKIIEITSRQPLNGYFSSGFFREIAMEQAERLGIKGIVDVYPTIFDYLEDYIGDVERICVIKGNNKLEEFHLYPTIFSNAGIECVVIPIEELADKLSLLQNAWVIEELTFDEIRSFPNEVIEALAQCRLHNAIKAILTTHDKRLFYVLRQTEFLGKALNPAEQQLLAAHLTPTFVWGSDEEIWEDALHSKKRYLLKHQCKGKSVDVYAGCLTDQDVWTTLLQPVRAQQMVLQQFIPQRKISGTIGSEKRNDYVAGTLLYFNQEFFGPGLYRTSSIPVTNLQDNRKIAQLIADAENPTPGIVYL